MLPKIFPRDFYFFTHNQDNGVVETFPNFSILKEITKTR